MGITCSRFSPRGTEPPAILAVTPGVKALVGEDVTLECWVSGVPPPQIAWHKGEAGPGRSQTASPIPAPGPPPAPGDVTHGVLGVLMGTFWGRRAGGGGVPGGQPARRAAAAGGAGGGRGAVHVPGSRRGGRCFCQHGAGCGL